MQVIPTNIRCMLLHLWYLLTKVHKKKHEAEEQQTQAAMDENFEVAEGSLLRA